MVLKKLTELFNQFTDGSLETRGAEYACSNWNDVQCYDYKKNDEDYDHGGIGNQTFTNKLALRFINNEKFPSDDKSWFSRKNMYIFIGCAVAVVVIIVIVVTVIYIKKKKQNNQTINDYIDYSFIYFVYIYHF